MKCLFPKKKHTSGVAGGPLTAPQLQGGKYRPPLAFWKKRKTTHKCSKHFPDDLTLGFGLVGKFFLQISVDWKLGFDFVIVSMFFSIKCVKRGAAPPLPGRYVCVREILCVWSPPP